MNFFKLKQLKPSDIILGIKGISKSAKQQFSRMKGTNILTFIYYGLLFDITANLWRPFAALFLERLGGAEFEISLLSALPGAVAAIVLLPGAIIFKRFANKKRATAAFILASRFLLLLIAFIPMLPPEIRPLLFVILVALMNCPDSLSQTSLQSFLGSVFDGNKRGEAIALRTKFGQAIIPIISLLTGIIITYAPQTDAQRMIFYQVFFVCAFIVGLFEVRMFSKLKVPITNEAIKVTSFSLSFAAKVIKDKRFRTFLIPAIIFMFTWQAGWPLTAIHQVKTLNATELWFAIFVLASGTSAFLSAGFWQKILRKKGNNAMLIISCIFLTFNMILTPLASTVQLFVLVSIFSGFSAVGINTALLNGVLGATPDEDRMLYIAFYNTAANITLFIAPFFAHALLTFLGNSNALFAVGGLRAITTFILWICFRKMTKEE